MLFSASANVVNQKYGLNIQNISISKPYGSKLKVMDKVFISFEYIYPTNKPELRVFATVSDEQKDKQIYQGSIKGNGIISGKGKISRFFTLKEAGEVTEIRLRVVDIDNNLIYEKHIPVSFIFENNKNLEDKKNDGINSKILNVQAVVGNKGTYPLRKNIFVNVQYDVNSEEGVHISVEPDTKCKYSYQGSINMYNGKGTVKKVFSLTEPCEVKSITATMNNAMWKVIQTKSIPVSYKFESMSK